MRCGLTLVELLVVITILTMVTAATIPLMAPATGQRKVRESARLVSTVLAQAQARALASGRPVGVWIERLWTTDASDDRANRSMDLFLCQTPPPYSGLSTSARCTASVSANTWVVDLWQQEPPSQSNPQPDTIPPGWVHPGDRIRFNYRGPTYQITGPTGGANVYSQDGSLKGQKIQIAVLSYDASPPVNRYAPFQIFRQPVKTADEPVTLPVGSLVDLGYSGIASNEFAVPVASAGANDPISGQSADYARPICIMFSASGSLDSVYIGIREKTGGRKASFEPFKPIAPVYLLMGQSAKETVNPLASNMNNQENVWVAVNPQSGLVTTSEVAIGPSYWQDNNISNPKLSDYQTAIIRSRAFARSQQNMGGR